MSKIVALLEIQKLSRDAKTVQELGFVAVNKTNKIHDYQQALFWIIDNGAVQITSASGNTIIDDDGPYALWVKSEISKYIKNKITDISCVSYNNEQSLGGVNNYLIPFMTHNDGILGGLWIECKVDMTEGGRQLLFEISEHYSQSLALIQLRKRNKSILAFGRFTRFKKYIIVALFLLMLVPVRLSITAPAEIVARKPVTISAPIEGILNDIVVRPGDMVRADEILATMDKTQLQSQKDAADQAMRTAKTALSRTGLESLRNDEKKVDLMRLRSEIKIKKIELDYASTLLKKTDIVAPKDGVIIFSDASNLRNKPVSTGEQIMMIADPNDYELLIRVPVQALLPMKTDENVDFYLNVRPFETNQATITSIGYQSSVDDDGLLTYKIRATMNGQNDMRIGWKGTAKIKTEWSILGYSLLRRPIIALRNMTGI